MSDEPKTKTPAELDKEYINEVMITARKLQLVDFVHFYYQHIQELTFNQIVEEYKKH